MKGKATLAKAPLSEGVLEISGYRRGLLIKDKAYYESTDPDSNVAPLTAIGSIRVEY